MAGGNYDRERERWERERGKRKSAVQQPLPAIVKPSTLQKGRARDIEDGSGRTGRYRDKSSRESGTDEEREGSGRRRSRTESQSGHDSEGATRHPSKRERKDTELPGRKARHLRGGNGNGANLTMDTRRTSRRESRKNWTVRKVESQRVPEPDVNGRHRAENVQKPARKESRRQRDVSRGHSRRESQQPLMARVEYSTQNSQDAGLPRHSSLVTPRITDKVPHRGATRSKSTQARGINYQRIPNQAAREFISESNQSSYLAGGASALTDAEKGAGRSANTLPKLGRKSSAAYLKIRGRGKCFWVTAALILLFLLIIILVGVVVARKKSKASTTGNLAGISRSSIPPNMRGTYYDPFTWADTKDFNLTYTDEKYADLPIMGLFTNWDDSAQANPSVPPLTEPFPYGKQPIRGVNLGGWLVLEPFITPSYFEKWDPKLGIIDEYTLSQQLGPGQAKKVLENHYANFLTEDSFKGIRDAGLDHVRIPYGYWVYLSLNGDPYVYQVSWRYLLRAIEYCRKYGLRVKLDLHAAPGGQNGWNHSGRQGQIQWLSGNDGDFFGNLTLVIHDRISKFFSQDRYKNLVTLYGLVNEPKMIFLDSNKVIAWSTQAYNIVKGNGYQGLVVFGDGFRGLPTWKGAFAGLDDMVLDVHQYVIFDTELISQTHTQKVKFACATWGAQIQRSIDKSTGFGPTMVGEWGEADTDCTLYLNNVGTGSRWEGTINTGNAATSVLQPHCPNQFQCSCQKANDTPDKYSDAYRQFLYMFAIAQMDSFEKGYGWTYWTWDTEDAYQWSYKKGLAAGILPQSAYQRNWSCSDAIPDFAELGLPESY